MKTYRHLLPQLTSFENLHGAFRKARRGKRTLPEGAEFEFNLEANLFALQEELRSQIYVSGEYRNFGSTGIQVVSQSIRPPGGGDQMLGIARSVAATSRRACQPHEIQLSRNFYVRERKLRLISAAPFRERVVHHALVA